MENFAADNALHTTIEQEQLDSKKNKIDGIIAVLTVIFVPSTGVAVGKRTYQLMKNSEYNRRF
jgi:hypothetical protein